jgi:hypothetical protein
MRRRRTQREVSKDPRREVLRVRLTVGERAQAEQLAEDRRTNVSELIRQLLARAYVATQATARAPEVE